MTVQIITARLRHPEAEEAAKDLYCFDSEEHGLVAEPFVASATDAIHYALRWSLGFDHFKPHGPDGPYCRSSEVQLAFTSSEDEADVLALESDVILELRLLGPSNGGHLYNWEVVHPDSACEAQGWEAGIFYEPAWLCPALLKYFPNGAPEQFWVQIKELQRGS